MTDGSSTVILVNLGSPAAPTVAGIRSFLREFLSDRRVVGLPRWLWLPILHLFILPFRPRRLVADYAGIWTKSGSPLVAIGYRQAAALQKCLAEEGTHVQVCWASTYGSPSLAEAAAGAGRLIVLPLYPQYSGSTTGSVQDRAAALERPADAAPLALERCYFSHPLYIRALAEQLRRHWEHHGRAARLLLSFHGLPKSMVAKGDPYAEQCRQTAALLAEELALADRDWMLCYQSRFGPAPWLSPYTDKTLVQWGREGLASVDVFCPGFAADCLETLVEIGEENRCLFQESGGGEYRLVPCLNDEPAHIQLFSALVRKHWAGD